MQKYQLKVPKKYTKDGEEKTVWIPVGTLIEIEKDGKTSRIVEIPAIDLTAHAFLVEPSTTATVTGEEINAGDIPF